MEAADAHYQSFLIRIWREDQANSIQKAGSPIIADETAGDGWLFQLEDIASGDTCYFNSSSALAGYVDTKLRTDAKPLQPEGNNAGA